MIEIQYRNGKFLAKGTFSVGIAGVYENKDFEDENIIIDIELDELLANLKKEKPVPSKQPQPPQVFVGDAGKKAFQEYITHLKTILYEPMRPYLMDKGEDGAAIAKGLEDYFNHKEEEIRKNIKQINDCILYFIFHDLELCGYPFWEIEEAVIPEIWDADESDEDVYERWEESIDYWGEAFYEQPNNGTMEKPDVEGRLRRQYPMFNFDGLYESMIPEVINLGYHIYIQFSDGWDACMIENACLSFDENFAPIEWHNH